MVKFYIAISMQKKSYGTLSEGAIFFVQSCVCVIILTIGFLLLYLF